MRGALGRVAMAVLFSATVWDTRGVLALKAVALQGGYVSEGQRLRDVLRDQIEVFARQIESGQGVGPDERALLHAILERSVAYPISLLRR